MIEIKMTVGPSFATELADATPTLAGLPIVTTPESVSYGDLTDAQLAQLRAVVAAHDPDKPEPVTTALAKVDLYRRMTDEEFDRMTVGVAAQSKRVQGIFDAAQNFRSDAPEWDLLKHMAAQLYGSERAAELMTP